MHAAPTVLQMGHIVRLHRVQLQEYADKAQVPTKLRLNPDRLPWRKPYYVALTKQPSWEGCIAGVCVRQ
eukprot:COSAG05_NODE_45_length_25418_cov_92.923299_12_plen_69_part_00